jgi:Phage capsid family
MTTDLIDRKTAEASFAALHTELGDVSAMLKKSKEEGDAQYKALSTHYDGVKADNVELQATVKKHVDDYAAIIAKTQALEEGLTNIKKELEAPIYKGGKDLQEADRKAAVNLQKALHIHKGGHPDAFRPDMANLVNPADYRSAALKFGKVGLQSKDEIFRSLTDAERKAFQFSSMDGSFFTPEMLGIEVDCNIECQYLNDLYQHISISRTQYMYPVVLDYAAIGSFQCDAGCDTNLGPEGNITHGNGQAYSFRAMFCLAKNVVAEANYPIMDFMVRSLQRSERINKNRVMMTGDGVNEPKGWVTAGGFLDMQTSGLKLNHIMVRRFLSSAPIEYGEVTAVMHQNTFAYIASQTDNNGRFIFGDGEMVYSPNSANARIRISNCMPDPTDNNVRGSDAVPFVAGDMVMAAGNWSMAVMQADKSPLTIELYTGGSTKWCSKWQASSEMGGSLLCTGAVRTLSIGA